MLNAFKKLRPQLFPTLFLFLVFFFLYLPIIILLVFSFNTREFPAPWEGFSLKWYYELFHTPEIWVAFFNSCIVGIASTFICLTLAVFMIYFLASGGKIGKFIPIFYGNLIIPETVLAVGLLSYFSLMHIPLGLLTIIVAHTLVGLGFTIPILYIRYRELDPKIFEASQTLGASHKQTFTKISLPLMTPALIATGLVTFILSFDDFILAYFTSGSSLTLSLYLLSSIRYGISPIINALASILLIITCTLVFLFFSLKTKTRIL